MKRSSALSLVLTGIFLLNCGRTNFGVPGADAAAVDGAHYDSTLTPTYVDTVKRDLPIGYWRLNDVGATAHDEIGQHDGVIASSCSHLPTGAIASDANGAMMFANNCTVNLGNAFRFLGRAPYSIEAWFATGFTGAGHIFARQARAGGGPTEGYSLLVASSEVFQERASGTGSNVHSAHAPFAANVLVHAVSTYDGTTMRLYVNGTLVGVPLITNTALQPIISDAVMGCSANVNCFTGLIDEVALYDRELTSAQVASHFAAGIR
jgi:hypothetical protein